MSEISSAILIQMAMSRQNVALSMMKQEADIQRSIVDMLTNTIEASGQVGSSSAGSSVDIMV